MIFEDIMGLLFLTSLSLAAFFPELNYVSVFMVLVIAFTADGIEAAIRLRTYRGNHAVLTKVREDLQKQALTYHPDVTVILPAFRKSQDLTRAIGSLLENGIPKDRILVVDDFSNDQFKTAEEAARRGIRVISISRNTKKVGAVNFALDEVDTDHVILMDSDCILNASYDKLKVAMIEMEQFGLDAMAVQVLPCPPELEVGPEPNNNHQRKNLLLELQSLEYKQAMVMGRGAMYAIEAHRSGHGVKRAEVSCVSGAFGIFRRTALKEIIDKFPTKEENFMGEDFERTLKILALNGRVGYSDEIVVFTEVPTSIASHFKQRVIWSEGIFRCFFSKFCIASCKKRLTGLVNVTYFTRDILLHPLKVFSIPFLVLYPLNFISMMMFYTFLTLFVVKKTSIDPVPTRTILFLFIYRFYMIVPTTIGYMNAVLHSIKQITWKRSYRIPQIEVIREWNHAGE